jgi:hypothetical protein
LVGLPTNRCHGRSCNIFSAFCITLLFYCSCTIPCCCCTTLSNSSSRTTSPAQPS